MLDASAERRRVIAAAALLLAPLVMLAADLVMWVGGEGAFWPWSVALWVSFFLYIPAILALVHLLRPEGDRLGLLGGSLALVGVMIGATIQGVMRAQSVAIDRLGPSVAEMISATYGEAPLLPTSISPGLTFPLGLVLLAIGVGRTGVGSLWTAAAVALGAILFPVGRIGGLLEVSLLSDALLLLGLGALGWRVWTRGAAWWQAPREPA